MEKSTLISIIIQNKKPPSLPPVCNWWQNTSTQRSIMSFPEVSGYSKTISIIPSIIILLQSASAVHWEAYSIRGTI